MRRSERNHIKGAFLYVLKTSLRSAEPDLSSSLGVSTLFSQHRTSFNLVNMLLFLFWVVLVYFYLTLELELIIIPDLKVKSVLSDRQSQNQSTVWSVNILRNASHKFPKAKLTYSNCSIAQPTVQTHLT